MRIAAIFLDAQYEERMPRSNGYRPKNAVRKEVEALREQLSTIPYDEWQRAQQVMLKITYALGKFHGPSRGMIQPRACKFCKFYGHTRQWCAARLQAEEEWKDRLIAEDDENVANSTLGERKRCEYIIDGIVCNARYCSCAL